MTHPYPPAPETKAERYARHTRNWAAFIGVCVAVAVVVSIVTGVVAAVQLTKLTSQVQSGAPPGCQSQGGPLPGC